MKPPSLSHRQRQVLEQLLAGKPNKEIGYALDVSEQTVKNEVQVIYAHFGINRTRQLLPIIDRVRQEIELAVCHSDHRE